MCEDENNGEWIMCMMMQGPNLMSKLITFLFLFIYAFRKKSFTVYSSHITKFG